MITRNLLSRSMIPKVLECAGAPCSSHGSLPSRVAERPEDGSRGPQPTVARGGNARRGATLGRWQTSARHASLRDAGAIRPQPWAEAHGYPRWSLRDKTENA